ARKQRRFSEFWLPRQGAKRTTCPISNSFNWEFSADGSVLSAGLGRFYDSTVLPCASYLTSLRYFPSTSVVQFVIARTHRKVAERLRLALVATTKLGCTLVKPVLVRAAVPG